MEENPSEESEVKQVDSTSIEQPYAHFRSKMLLIARVLFFACAAFALAWPFLASIEWVAPNKSPYGETEGAVIALAVYSIALPVAAGLVTLIKRRTWPLYSVGVTAILTLAYWFTNPGNRAETYDLYPVTLYGGLLLLATTILLLGARHTPPNSSMRIVRATLLTLASLAIIASFVFSLHGLTTITLNFIATSKPITAPSKAPNALTDWLPNGPSYFRMVEDVGNFARPGVEASRLALGSYEGYIELGKDPDGKDCAYDIVGTGSDGGKVRFLRAKNGPGFTADVSDGKEPVWKSGPEAIVVQSFWAPQLFLYDGYVEGGGSSFCSLRFIDKLLIPVDDGEFFFDRDASNTYFDMAEQIYDAKVLDLLGISAWERATFADRKTELGDWRENLFRATSVVTATKTAEESKILFADNDPDMFSNIEITLVPADKKDITAPSGATPWWQGEPEGVSISLTE